jgi:hypothetical protein
LHSGGVSCRTSAAAVEGLDLGQLVALDQGRGLDVEGDHHGADLRGLVG